MQLDEADVRHLLRRTEVVDRTPRVQQLLALGDGTTVDVEVAVDDVMNVPTGNAVPTLTFTFPADEDWQRGVELNEFWLDRLTTTSRPFGERMAYFWHGHLCTEMGKAGGAVPMRTQIDLFRKQGLGPIPALVKTMAIQAAMLRYLDNWQNFAGSPNQNWARELMELFLLGVGNYTEDDVEAATAAWTGHGFSDWETGAYAFQLENHESDAQTFLGRTVNDWGPTHGQPAQAGNETIDVILGDGVVPANSNPEVTTGNGGRPTREVAAEFLSKKLWQEFAEATTGGVPAGALDTMRSALLGSDFDARTWVRAMLTHPDFYTDTVKSGLVRQPFEYVAALLVATGLTAEQGAQLWLMDQAGQVPLYPPNVSGWRPNGYWVNAAAMEARNAIAVGMTYPILADYWEHPWEQRHLDTIDLPGGSITRLEVTGTWDDDPAPISDAELVDRLLQYMDLDYSAATRQELVDFCASVRTGPDGSAGHRYRALALSLLVPEMHIA